MSTDKPVPAPQTPDDLIAAVRARTPARILIGRAGPAYRTATQLELRRDHAAAIDAVHDEVDLVGDFGAEFVARHGLFAVKTAAADKREYLMRPDLGRRLDDAGRAEVAGRCAHGAELQIVIGDGLSAAAVRAQVPGLLPRLLERAGAAGLRTGQTFFVRHCRVGLLNEVGELLSPEVVVLLIGERPGLATAESLSAYMAFRPKAGHTDAQRNLISNIHARGVDLDSAARRILALAGQMRTRAISGVTVKEQLTPLPPPDSFAALSDDPR